MKVMENAVQANGRLQKLLREHVENLAGRIGERSPFRYASLEAARLYIENRLSQVGYRVEHQIYQVEGRDYRNVIAGKIGSKRDNKVFIVGAHYDTVWGTPGADDNASGVACLLELARLLVDANPAVTINMVAFTLEEPPFFQTPYMGSWVYAKEVKKERTRIVGMASLEMVGYYRDESDSQGFPFPLMRLFYPSQGNFIVVAGNLQSRRLVGRLGSSLAAQTQLPVEQVALPLIPALSFSDNWSFWQEGYEAVMITDTAFYRNPNYHRRSDLPQTLDYGRMALLASGLSRVLATLS